jgi:hypothetical protein
MDTDTYNRIVGTLRSTPATACPDLPRIASSHPNVSTSTVYSIYSQEVQYHVMRTHNALVEACPALMRRYLAKQTDVLELCEEWKLPPCVVMRRLLECSSLLAPGRRTNVAGGDPSGVPKSVIAKIFKDPDTLRSYVSPACLDLLEQELHVDGLADLYHRDYTLLIERLVQDVRECVLIDCICGPESDRARRQAGLTYETKLYEHLHADDISFWTEDELRELNFIKTPDALLKVPIAVDGQVVSWIDSKATFCDAKSHERLLKVQYDSYVNRFGPGLVIYWHGYLRDITDKRGGESSGVCVVAEWPEEILRLPRL